MVNKKNLFCLYCLSIMPMIMNQYGFSRTAGAITGFINLFNPIGVFFTILFFVGVCGNMFSSHTRKKFGFLGLLGIVIAEVYTYFTAYNYGSGQPIDMEKARSYVLVPEFYIGIVISLLCVIIYLIYVHGKSF